MVICYSIRVRVEEYQCVSNKDIFGGRVRVAGTNISKYYIPEVGAEPLINHLLAHSVSNINYKDRQRLCNVPIMEYKYIVCI